MVAGPLSRRWSGRWPRSFRLYQSAGAQAALAAVTALQAFLLLHSASDSDSATLPFAQFSLTVMWLSLALSASSALFGAPLLIRPQRRPAAVFWQKQCVFALCCALCSMMLLLWWQASVFAAVGFALAHLLALLRAFLKQLQQQQGAYNKVAVEDWWYALLTIGATLLLFCFDALSLAAVGWLNALVLLLLLLMDKAMFRTLQRPVSAKWRLVLWSQAWQQQGKAACSGVLAVELLANSYMYLLSGWHGAAAVAPYAAAALLFRPAGVILQGMQQRWRPELREAVLGRQSMQLLRSEMQRVSLLAVLLNAVAAALLLCFAPELIWPAVATAEFSLICLMMAVLTALRAARQAPVLQLQAQNRFSLVARLQWPLAWCTFSGAVLLLATAAEAFLLPLLLVGETVLYWQLRRHSSVSDDAQRGD